MSQTEPQPDSSGAASPDDGPPPFRYGARLAGEIESRWQDWWAANGTFDSPNPAGPLAAGFGQQAGRPQVLRPGLLPLPERDRAACRASARLHRHRRVRQVPADDRAPRPARAGIRRVRAARRAVRDRYRPASAGDHRGQHRQHAPPAPPPRPGPRHPPGDLHRGPWLLPLDPVDLPQDLQQLVRRADRAGPADRGAGRRVRDRPPGHAGRPAVERARPAGSGAS